MLKTKRIILCIVYILFEDIKTGMNIKTLISIDLDLSSTLDDAFDVFYWYSEFVMQMALRALIVKTKRLYKPTQFPWGGFESLYIKQTHHWQLSTQQYQ